MIRMKKEKEAVLKRSGIKNFSSSCFGFCFLKIFLTSVFFLLPYMFCFTFKVSTSTDDCSLLAPESCASSSLFTFTFITKLEITRGLETKCRLLDAVIQKWKCFDNNPFDAKFNKLGLSWAKLSKIGT